MRNYNNRDSRREEELNDSQGDVRDIKQHHRGLLVENQK